MFNPTASRGPRGFTLLELLVVVSIISLLIALLLPSLRMSREVGRQAACHSNLRQFAMAFQIYASQYNEWFVPIRENVNAGWVSWNRNRALRTLLGHEPGADFRDDVKCPSLSPNAIGSAGMSRNFFGFNRTPQNWNWHSLAINRSRITRASSTIQGVDGTDWHIWKSYANYIANWDIFGDTRLWSVAYRHLDGASVQYFDTHVEAVNKRELYPGIPTEVNEIWSINAAAFPPEPN